MRRSSWCVSLKPFAIINILPVCACVFSNVVYARVVRLFACSAGPCLILARSRCCVVVLCDSIVSRV